MMDWSGHDAGTGWLMMAAVLVLFWLLFVAIGLAVYRDLTGSRRGSSHDAQRLLDERLARGELDPEDYERRSALLRHTR